MDAQTDPHAAGAGAGDDDAYYHLWTPPWAQEKSSGRLGYVGRVQTSVRPHMRAGLVKLFHGVTLHGRNVVAWHHDRPRQSSHSRRAFPANLTSGGTMSPPLSRIRDGRAPGGRHHSLRRRACTRPDNGDAPLDSAPELPCSPGSIFGVAQGAGFMTAPPGTTPCVANRHKAISSFRASATTITLRMRAPVPLTRSRNQLTSAEPGW